VVGGGRSASWRAFKKGGERERSGAQARRLVATGCGVVSWGTGALVRFTSSFATIFPLYIYIYIYNNCRVHVIKTLIYI
jgi:hypothetical protein